MDDEGRAIVHNVAAVARELGKAREQVHRLIKRCRLDPNGFCA